MGETNSAEVNIKKKKVQISMEAHRVVRRQGSHIF
jgi:hypothetical protein